MTNNNLFKLLLVAILVTFLPSCKKIVQGCMDPIACNYSEDVTEDNGSCTFPQVNLNCNGVCINDVDEDGVCDENEISGCMDSLACNYDPNATDQLLNSCDYESCLGCTDANSFNYNPSAIIDDGSCVLCVYGCTDPISFNYD